MSTRARNFRSVVRNVFARLTALFVLVASSGGSIDAQVRLVGEDMSTVDIPQLNNTSVNIFKPERPDRQGRATYYFVPTFVFEGDPSTGPTVKRLEPKGLQLFLLVSPPIVQRSLAQDRRQVAPVRDSDLIKIMLDTYEISAPQAGDHGLPEFKLGYLKDNNPSRIPLTLTFNSPSDRQTAIEHLQAGTGLLQVAIRYSANALVTVRRSSARLYAHKMKETSAWRTLSGNGSGYTVGAPEGTVAVGPMIMSRQQKEAFAGALREELRLEYDLEEPYDAAELKLLRDEVDKYVGLMVGAEHELSFEDFVKERDRWARYGFDPKDLASARVDRISADVKNYLSTEESRKQTAGGSTSANVMDYFSGSLAGNYSDDVLKKHLSDRGFNITVDQRAWVPKSVNVYLVTTEQMARDLDVSIRVSRAARKLTNLYTTATTTTVVRPELAREQRIIAGKVDGRNGKHKNPEFIFETFSVTEEIGAPGRYRIQFGVPFPDKPVVAVSTLDGDMFAEIHGSGIDRAGFYVEGRGIRDHGRKQFTFQFTAIY